MKAPLTKRRILIILRKEMPNLRQEYGVDRIAIYGSFAKGNHTKKSDVDILVQLARPLGLKFVELANHLEKVLGAKVDLATFDTLQRSLENPRYKHIASDIRNRLLFV